MKKEEKETTKSATKSGGKRTHISQALFPKVSLPKALAIPKAIKEQCGGERAFPLDVALATGISPSSSGWQEISGSAVAYGLTKGGYGAKEIELTDLGRRAVTSRENGEDKAALVEAVLRPTAMKKFFEKYADSKFPTRDEIAENALGSFGVPKNRCKDALRIIRENGEFAGVIRKTKHGDYVSLTPSAIKESSPQDDSVVPLPNSTNGEANPDDDTSPRSKARDTLPSLSPSNNRVYIGHGKNRDIAKQVKDILEFGQFTPIVSVERETTAVPVPQKIFEDMRSCCAGIIHITSEGELIDSGGEKHPRINENVLIEIGAAMALYKDKLILLVEKGVTMPSNLQGLYHCEYEGAVLGTEAMPRLIKAFGKFRMPS